MNDGTESPVRDSADDRPHFSPGQWVCVWAQVADNSELARHPEDIALKFRNHAAQFVGGILRDHVFSPPEGSYPKDAPRCYHLFRGATWDAGTLVRCESRQGPGHLHEGGGFRWEDSQTYGYIEER